MGGATRLGLVAAALLCGRAAWAAPACVGGVSGLPPADCAGERFQALAWRGETEADDARAVILDRLGRRAESLSDHGAVRAILAAQPGPPAEGGVLPALRAVSDGFDGRLEGLR